ncbi:MAG TPA: SdrD B-like domain-containing protein, partial [Anaerolineales bacterium]|nr:SdrD B-like domain-containing protein [Anaerolineales bacterium]
PTEAPTNTPTETSTETPTETPTNTPTATNTPLPNTLCLGSYVWIDANNNGVQDAGESGLSGATVSLLVDDGTGNFVPATDLSGNAVADQTTTTAGTYLFCNLPAGSYKVQVTPPVGYNPTGSNSSNDDDIAGDSNIASTPSTGVFESPVIVLSANSETTEAGGFAGDNQDDADDSNGNMTVDFGFVPVPTATPTNTPTETPTETPTNTPTETPT